ncbi:PH domain-containing protein, partial [candidate division WWE3 bacterium]|nr:PH domain-containing protein [candidate division WWE3 bacterium]
QHWFVFRDPVIIATFIPFVLAFVIFMVSTLKGDQGIYYFVNRGAAGLAILSVVFGSLLFLWKLFLWNKTVYLVTTKRVIILTRYGLFKHDDRETALKMIQDVKSEVTGMQPALYGFGDVTVQVSSQDARLILEKVPHPRKVQQIIVSEAHLKGDQNSSNSSSARTNGWDDI